MDSVAPTLVAARIALPPEGARPAWGGPAPVVAVAPTLATARPVFQTIAVIAYPRISNLDEFQPLKNIPGVRLQWVRSPVELAGLVPGREWIVLPGSKHTSGDLAWLRAQGLAAAVAAFAGQGGAVLGICGGLQMLGEALIDPHGIDGNAPGLELYLHGLFEDPAALQALFDPGGNQALPTLDAVFDGLADYIGRYFEPDFLAGLIQPVQAPVQLRASNP